MSKPTSLVELGFKVEPMRGTDEKGNAWVYKVTGPAPVFYVKRTKRGNLLAFRSKNVTIDSTIEGLYNFKEQTSGGKPDLVGVRVAQTQPRTVPRKKAA